MGGTVVPCIANGGRWAQAPGHAASVVARTRRGWRHGVLALNAILPVAYVDRLGVPRPA
jgi:hypothetical protein